MCEFFLTLFTVLLSVQVIQEAKENALNYKGLGLGVMGEFSYICNSLHNKHTSVCLGVYPLLLGIFCFWSYDILLTLSGSLWHLSSFFPKYVHNLHKYCDSCKSSHVCMIKAVTSEFTCIACTIYPPTIVSFPHVLHTSSDQIE